MRVATPFAECGALLGEGPVWHDGVLRWVDIRSGTVHAADEAGTRLDDVVAGAPVSFAWPRRDGGLLLGRRDGLYVTTATGDAPLVALPLRADDARLNDGKADPAGHFVAGTMSDTFVPGRGDLFRVSSQGDVSLLVTGVTISNGLAWSPDGTTLYYVDSATRRLDAMAYDVATGAVGPRRPVVAFPERDGSPDGITVDAEGCVWVAFWGGGAVRRYDPAGALTDEVRVPTAGVTSCCFGGAGMSLLFVTTAREPCPDDPAAGHVYVTRPDVPGLPTVVFDG